MAYETVGFDVDDGIATLTLQRPDRLNAVTGQLVREFLDVLDRVDGDDAVRALIVTGAGRAFCAGADLHRGAATFAMQPGQVERADGSLDYRREEGRDMGGILALRLFRALKPIIGAINGAAVGLGATLTLPMDVRLASDTARFGFVFARRGMVPEAASSWFLPRIVGISRALEWCFDGRLVPADEALAGGLVRSVHPADELLPAAHALARGMVANSSAVSIALTRQMLWRGLGASHPMDGHRPESWGTLARGRGGDAAEGVAAFLEKRAPAFPDRVSADMPDFFPWWEEPTFS